MAQPAANLESSTQGAGKSGSIEDIALIEEQFDSGLMDLLEHYEPVEKLEDIPFDLLNERYKIDPKSPCPEFDSGASKAYAAEDLLAPKQKIIALVCDNKIPYRQIAMDELRGMVHPGMMSLREAGAVKLSSNKEISQVLFVDKPPKTRISDIIASGKKLHDRTIIDQILTPVIGALAAASEKGICHGTINSDNVFFSDNMAILRECSSEPQGLSQQSLFEPIERLIAEPMARGASTQKTDSYALGMLIFDLMFGLEKFKVLSRENLIKLLLEKGAYHTFIAAREVSETFADFFRGTLTENKQERWGVEQLSQWLAGKRFNLIMPSIPKEATRPFVFNETDYFNCRSLANAIYAGWPTASKQVRQGNLDRWLEMSVHQSDRADLVSRTIESYGGEVGGTERVNNDMLSRLIIALDPTSPIRHKAISLNVDGIGLMLNNLYFKQEHSKIELLRRVIESDLPTYWSESSEAEKTPLTSTILWKLQHIRAHMKFSSFGFGMERMVYDLNPTLPCQNKWLLPYHATTIAGTLNILDNLAKTHSQNTSFADRHIAAFLASKIEMTKEIKFNQLTHVPKLRDHPELLALRIISMAQDKNHKKKMIGLATWAAVRIDNILEEIHSRKLRRSIREKLKVAAKTGMVSRVLAVMVENDLTKEDHQGFTRAHSVYLRNSAKIASLENGEKLDRMSADFGGRIAVFAGYFVLAVSFYSVIDAYLY